MQSPVEPGSPSPSTPSSGSPPPDDVPFVTSQQRTQATQQAAASPSTAKRRLPPVGHGSSMRDAKSRRREEGSGRDRDRRGPREGGGTMYFAQMDEKGNKKDKDELIDAQLVDNLREEFGDPFQDYLIKS